MPPRRAPVVRAGGVIANTQNNKRLRRGGGHCEEVGEEVAQPPAVRPRHERREPNWTLESDVTDVFLEDYGGTLDITVDVFFTRYSESRVVRHGEGGDQLTYFLNDPLQYVAAEGMQRVERWASYQCFWTADQLIEEGITTLRAWRNAPDKKKERFSRPMGRLLDDALEVAQERSNANAQSVNGREIKGAYESICNATWSYVESGHEGFPFGMRAFAGRPNRMWSEMEVDVDLGNNEFDRMDTQRASDLEICVLTSKRGWPYNHFREAKRRSLAISRDDEIHVYIRREIMRVWYKIYGGLDAWLVKKKSGCPRPLLVMGTPGIGKSHGVGSFLLHSLLHFHGGALDVVAYFMSKSAYLIYNERAGVPGRVVCYNNHRSAVKVISNMQSTKKGYIIVDICHKGQTPHFELPYRRWGVLVLTSPDVDHYYHWSKDKRTWSVVINCDEVRDIQAFVVWRRLSPLPSWIDLSEEERSKVAMELDEEWSIVEERIELVGPIPRHVLDGESYDGHLSSMYGVLRELNGTIVNPCRKLIGDGAAWKDSVVSEKVVKVVRVPCGFGDSDSYRCRAVSQAVGEVLSCMTYVLLWRETPIDNVLRLLRDVNPSPLEAYARPALLMPLAFYAISRRLQYLPREDETLKGSSVLSNMTEEQLKLVACIPLPAAGQERIPKCEYMVLYVPSTETQAVVDGFFFVEGRFRRCGEGARGEAPSKTIVLMQVATSARHHTSTSKVQEFKGTIANAFVNWDTFSQDMSWEIVYVNKADRGVVTARQRCANNGGKTRKSSRVDAALPMEDPAATLEFWDRIDQYRVTLEGTAHKKLLTARDKVSDDIRDAAAR